MITLRPFHLIGATFVSTGGGTADPILGTPMGVSTLRITNTTAGAVKVGIGDTAAQAVAALSAQYVTIPSNAIDYLAVSNTARYIACDTAAIPMILGTGGF